MRVYTAVKGGSARRDTRTDRSFGKVVEAATKLQLDGIGYSGGGLSGLPVVSVPTAMLAMKRINHAPPMLSRPHAHPCRTRLDATSSTASTRPLFSRPRVISRARGARDRSRASRYISRARPPRAALLSTPAGPAPARRRAAARRVQLWYESGWDRGGEKSANECQKNATFIEE